MKVEVHDYKGCYDSAANRFIEAFSTDTSLDNETKEFMFSFCENYTDLLNIDAFSTVLPMIQNVKVPHTTKWKLDTPQNREVVFDNTKRSISTLDVNLTSLQLFHDVEGTVRGIIEQFAHTAHLEFFKYLDSQLPIDEIFEYNIHERTLFGNFPNYINHLISYLKKRNINRGWIVVPPSIISLFNLIPINYWQLVQGIPYPSIELIGSLHIPTLGLKELTLDVYSGNYQMTSIDGEKVFIGNYDSKENESLAVGLDLIYKTTASTLQLIMHLVCLRTPEFTNNYSICQFKPCKN